MTNPHPTPHRFQPVPAVPIVVMPSPEGVQIVRAGGGLFMAPTVREAVAAAIGRGKEN